MKIEDISFGALKGLDPDRLRLTLESPLTIVARPDEPVAALAKRCTGNPSEFVLIIEKARPVGFVVPGLLLRTMGEHGMKPDALPKAVGLLENMSGGSFRTLIGDVVQKWRDELYWCENGEHYTGYKPCKEHG